MLLRLAYSIHCVVFLCPLFLFFFFFFFNDTATTEIYTLSLHDALPISVGVLTWRRAVARMLLNCLRRSRGYQHWWPLWPRRRDRKSTRLNSSHLVISYAVFCLKKKKKNKDNGGTNEQVTSYSTLVERI